MFRARLLLKPDTEVSVPSVAWRSREARPPPTPAHVTHRAHSARRMIGSLPWRQAAHDQARRLQPPSRSQRTGWKLTAEEALEAFAAAPRVAGQGHQILDAYTQHHARVKHTIHDPQKFRPFPRLDTKKVGLPSRSREPSSSGERTSCANNTGATHDEANDQPTSLFLSAAAKAYRVGCVVGCELLDQTLR